MTRNREQQQDAALEALLEAARREPPVPSDALMARVLADAQAVQPAGRGTRAAPLRLRRAVLGLLGGGRGVGGLLTATLVGFWIGVAPPEGLPDLAATFWASSDDTAGVPMAELELLPDANGFGWMTEEG